MLCFAEAGLSQAEVPCEVSLCIYISGCLNHCKDCSYPELQITDYGNPLSEYLFDLVELYLPRITCVCFLGEGENTKEDREELINYANFIKAKGLKICLYSGRNTDIEDWMRGFEYIKLGAFDINRGALTEKTTNQVMFQKINDDYKDITSKFL